MFRALMRHKQRLLVQMQRAEVISSGSATEAPSDRGDMNNAKLRDEWGFEGFDLDAVIAELKERIRESRRGAGLTAFGGGGAASPGFRRPPPADAGEKIISEFFLSEFLYFGEN